MKKLIGSLLLAGCFYAGAVCAAVNINTATQSELESVRGIGPSKAKAIVDYREKGGSFKSLDDLDNVKGFGKAAIDKLRSELTVEAEKSRKP